MYRAAKLALVLLLCTSALPAYASTAVRADRLSGNWAGYVAAHGEYSAVGATWQVPAIAPTSTLMGDVTWVGIGGSRTHDLIQAGTQGVVQNGHVQYWAWYELLPDYQQVVPMPVAAGDKVSASILEVSADLWLVSIANLTTGTTYYKTLEYDSKHSSAEWIEEMPNVFGKEGTQLYAPLSEFGTAVFSSAFAIVDGMYQSIDTVRASATSLVAKNNKRLVIAEPQDIVDGGFVVTRNKAVPSPSTKRHAKASDIIWTKP